MIVNSKSLATLVNQIFMAMGCHKKEAKTITQHLVTANLMGHDSHGVGMIPIYVKGFHQKILFPNVTPELIKDEPSMMVFNGNRGFGQSITNLAMKHCIARCKETGLVLMGINNSGHMGRIGTYGEQCAEVGLISIHFVNVTDRSPSVAPYGGTQARFGTNPICIAMPRGAELDPIVLDFATSKVAVGKIRVAINKDEMLPDGWVIDHSGNPSNNPRVMEQHIYPNEKSDVPEGAVLPMGDYKGFGLSLFCEILGGIMSGGKTIQPANERLGGVINNMMSIVIDPNQLVNNSSLQEELKLLINYVKSSPNASESDPVALPGEIERRRQKDRLEAGINIDDETFEQIIKAGESLKIDGSKIIK